VPNNKPRYHHPNHSVGTELWVEANNAGLDAELRPYQKNGVQWLSTLRGLELGGCLADDMGLGKTIQVLGLLNMSRRKKEKGTDLLVVPASLVDNWRLEIERFAPRLKVLIAHPSRIPSPELKKLPTKRVAAHDAVITTYGTVMRTGWMKEHPWRHVILDEAQAIKNPGAKQTKAVKAMPSKWRLALTGTPVENRLGDLWSIFDFLNPGLLGSAKAFNGLCKSMAKSEQGYAPLRRLVQPYILRRLKTDKNVIADLPDKTEVTAHCLLTKRQAALYQQSVDEMKKAIEELDGIERRGVVLAFLMRFKQICNHPSQWLGDGAYEPADSGKLSRLRELCESIAARQDKVLVFTQFREMTEPLLGYLTDVFGQSGLVLHGGTPVKKRQGLVKSFQEDDRVPFMVLSLKAGGTGLNLTAASHVIHFDRWWNPAVENQATDRAFRIGQKKNVLVHKFVCRGTVEERIDELIASKQKLSDEVLSQGAESSLTEMSNEELISMVSLDLSSALEG
jgi:non-specific serine/threonine protein kinase